MDELPPALRPTLAAHREALAGWTDQRYTDVLLRGYGADVAPITWMVAAIGWAADDEHRLGMVLGGLLDRARAAADDPLAPWLAAWPLTRLRLPSGRRQHLTALRGIFEDRAVPPLMALSSRPGTDRAALYAAVAALTRPTKRRPMSLEVRAHFVDGLQDVDELVRAVCDEALLRAAEAEARWSR